MKKYLVEFIGAFFLVFTIGMTAIGSDAVVSAPFAIGAILMVMIFAGGHISGGHFNPAVTLAATLRGACPASDVPGYMIGQSLGAVVAALAVRFLKPTALAALKIFHPVAAPALLAEFLFTFALCYVVLQVATAKGTSGNSFYGLAIGATVTCGAFAVGAISGAAFNPAVAIGLSVLGFLSWSDIWVFLVANFAAAVVASVAFKTVNASET